MKFKDLFMSKKQVKTSKKKEVKKEIVQPKKQVEVQPEVVLPKMIGKKQVKTVDVSDKGLYIVTDVEGTVYTLPESEYTDLV